MHLAGGRGGRRGGQGPLMLNLLPHSMGASLQQRPKHLMQREEGMCVKLRQVNNQGPCWLDVRPRPTHGINNNSRRTSR